MKCLRPKTKHTLKNDNSGKKFTNARSTALVIVHIKSSVNRSHINCWVLNARFNFNAYRSYPIRKHSTTKLLQRTKHTNAFEYIYNAKISFQLKWLPPQNLIA